MKNHKTLFGWLAAMLLAAGSDQVSAQAVSDQPASPTAQDQIVRMSQFEVTTTQGHGYTSTNAAEGFKTDESLLNIPQGDLVVTRDLLDDLGYANSGDVLQYFGGSMFFNGESMDLRGFRISYPYTDEMPDNQWYGDNAIIDSYEIIKGPAQVLYVNATLSGVVVRATKKPLPFDQDVLTASIDDNGLYRFTADLTGPLGNLGDAKIFYRLVAAYQHGNYGGFVNEKDNREILMPEFAVQYRNTYVRVYYNLQDMNHLVGGLALLTPYGQLYTGAGRRDANYPPNALVHMESETTKFEIDQKISETWENRLEGAYWRFHVYGSTLEVDQYDWDNLTEQWYNTLYNPLYHYWTVLDDFTGKYDLGPANWTMKNGDAFGFAFSVWTENEQFWETSGFGGSSGFVTIPFNNQAALNSLVTPGIQQFTPPSPAQGGIGSRLNTSLSSIYWQHNIDVIPDRLTLVGGFTEAAVETKSIVNESILPFNAVDVPLGQFLHRVGAILHVTNEISLYALNATSFTPPTNGAVLESGQLPPPQAGKSNEVGIKTALLGGKISGEFAYFHMVLQNQVDIVGGFFPNGQTFSTLIGSTNQEGVDGDLALTVLPGWQMVGAFYVGHDRNYLDQPVDTSYDNSWSLYNRYNFSRGTPLSGIAIGRGVTRVGGRWMDSGGLVDSSYNVPALLKMQTGTLVNLFIEYQPNRHWSFRLRCDNALDQAYPLAAQGAEFVDAVPPRNFTFETDFKF